MKQHLIMLIAMIISCYGASGSVGESDMPIIRWLRDNEFRVEREVEQFLVSQEEELKDPLIRAMIEGELREQWETQAPVASADFAKDGGIPTIQIDVDRLRLIMGKREETPTYDLGTPIAPARSADFGDAVNQHDDQGSPALARSLRSWVTPKATPKADAIKLDVLERAPYAGRDTAGPSDSDCLQATCMWTTMGVIVVALYLMVILFVSGVLKQP